MANKQYKSGDKIGTYIGYGIVIAIAIVALILFVKFIIWLVQQ